VSKPSRQNLIGGHLSTERCLPAFLKLSVSKMEPEFPDFLLHLTTFPDKLIKTMPDDAKVLTKVLTTKKRLSSSRTTQFALRVVCVGSILDSFGLAMVILA